MASCSIVVLVLLNAIDLVVGLDFLGYGLWLGACGGRARQQSSLF